MGVRGRQVFSYRYREFSGLLVDRGVWGLILGAEGSVEGVYSGGPQLLRVYVCRLMAYNYV